MARQTTRLLRFTLVATGLIFVFFLFSRGSTSAPAVSTPKVVKQSVKTTSAQTTTDSYQDLKKQSAKGTVKATFVALARNSDLWPLVNSIRNVEDRFNHKYGYDWVFLNEVPFSEQFKKVTSSFVSGEAKFGLIPKEHWSFPEWIDLNKAAKAREDMKKANVIYGDSIPYRHMCRYESGFFYRHELLADYEYYWRVDPDIKLHCDINYDVFQFMKDNNKKYGFTISIHEYEATIKTLWDTTKAFMKENPKYLHKNNMMDFISEDGGATYNMCHFWSNFEVASLDFWRDEAYSEYFDFLDKAGGFFYERWGDAPVHSIAAALFLDRSELHYFSDIGYFHAPFHNCPVDEAFRLENRCLCSPKDDFTFKGFSCGNRYFQVNQLTKPANWQEYA